MTINIEFFLAGRPLLFFQRKQLVKFFYGGAVITAVCGTTWNIHTLFAVKSAGNKLANEKRGREIAFADKSVAT